MATDPRINYAPRQGGGFTPQLVPAPAFRPTPQLRAFSPQTQNLEAGGHFLAKLIDAIAQARREDAEKERSGDVRNTLSEILGLQPVPEDEAVALSSLISNVSPESMLTDGTLPVENALGFRVEQEPTSGPLAEALLRPRLDPAQPYQRGGIVGYDSSLDAANLASLRDPADPGRLVSGLHETAGTPIRLSSAAPQYGEAPFIPPEQTPGPMIPPQRRTTEQIQKDLRVIPEIEEPGYITPDGTFVARDDERIGKPTQRYLRGEELLTALISDPALADMQPGDINPIQQMLLESRIKEDPSAEWEDMPASYGESVGQPGVLFQQSNITGKIEKISDVQAPVKKSNPKAVIMGVATDHNGLPLVINGKQNYRHAIFQDGEPLLGEDGQPLSFYAPKGADTEVNLNSNVVQESHPDMSTAMSTAWQRGEASKDQFNRADKMVELVEAMKTSQFGAGAEMKRAAREWITIASDVLGIATPEYDKDETAHSVLEAWVNDFVLPRVKELGARPTDKDLQFIIDAMPNLVKTQKGNLVLIAAIRDLAERRMQEGNYMMDFLQLTREQDPEGRFTYKEGENQDHIGQALTRGYWERYRMMRDEEFAASQNNGMDNRQRENHFRDVINSFKENTDTGVFEYQLSDDEFGSMMDTWAVAVEEKEV